MEDAIFLSRILAFFPEGGYSPLVAEYLLNRHNTLLESLFALISFIET